MDYQEKFDLWKKWIPEVSDTLDAMTEEEKKFAFGSNLVFGTGGLRGIMQVGTNAMNYYTVKKATMGLAEVISNYDDDAKKRGVAISYDTRQNSQEFAEIVAETLSNYGINIYMSDTYRPTPVLSYAVRELGCIAGVMITASHNPKEYNGYKCYWEDGGQLPPKVSADLIAVIDKQDEFKELLINKDLINYFGEEIDEKYKKEILKQGLNISGDIKICYTPLYGCGAEYVPEILERVGFDNVVLVDEQMRADGTFPNAPYPNPESDAAWESAIDIAGDEGCEIVIATDPDADRVGVMAWDGKKYVRFSGNHIAIMLLEFLLHHAHLPEPPAVITTIVSTRMAEKICKENNIAYFDVYTGFKFIAEKILEFEKDNSYKFLFGFEESIGYLKGDYCRDKDSIIGSLLICQMAQKLKDEGITMFDYLENIEEKYGKLYEETINVVKSGFNASAEMQEIMSSLREGEKKEFAELKMKIVKDYLKEEYPSDMLVWEFESGSRLCIRPSGTEPKIKYYISAVSEEELSKIKEAIN